MGETFFPEREQVRNFPAPRKESDMNDHSLNDSANQGGFLNWLDRLADRSEKKHKEKMRKKYPLLFPERTEEIRETPPDTGAKAALELLEAHCADCTICKSRTTIEDMCSNGKEMIEKAKKLYERAPVVSAMKMLDEHYLTCDLCKNSATIETMCSIGKPIAENMKRLYDMDPITSAGNLLMAHMLNCSVCQKGIPTYNHDSMCLVGTTMRENRDQALEKAFEKLKREIDATCRRAENAISSSTRCPRCASTNVTAQRKGFGLGKAVAGGVLLGPIGLLGGFVGSAGIRLTCLSCGHSWSS